MNTTDSGNQLTKAAKEGNLTKTKELLKQGVDMNIRNINERTPLHLSARHGHLKIARFLLTRPEIDVNAKDKRNRTPLHLAAQYGHLKIARILLTRQEIDVNAKDKRNKTPLHLAIAKKHKGIIRFLRGVIIIKNVKKMGIIKQSHPHSNTSSSRKHIPRTPLSKVVKRKIYRNPKTGARYHLRKSKITGRMYKQYLPRK